MTQVRFPHLRITPVTVVLLVERDWHGSRIKSLLLRSGLGVHLRRRECLTGAPTCAGCARKADCWYSIAFDTEAAATGGARLQHGDAHRPHPYYLTAAPDFRSRLEAGTELAVRLCVFGNPEPLFGKLLAAIAEAGGSGNWGGPFRIDRVVSLVNPLQRTHGVKPFPFPSWSPPEARDVWRLRIRMTSPLRIREKGQLVRQPDFVRFVLALGRRIHLLAGMYSTDVELPRGWSLELAALAAACDVEAYDWQYLREERTSGRQKREVPMDGMLGGLAVQGRLTELYPFLLAGQWMGVGASTGHGLGGYWVEAPE